MIANLANGFLKELPSQMLDKRQLSKRQICDYTCRSGSNNNNHNNRLANSSKRRAFIEISSL